jgi:hypothetical protein
VGFAAEDFTELQWITARDAPRSFAFWARVPGAGCGAGFGHGMNGLVKPEIGVAERPGGYRGQA